MPATNLPVLRDPLIGRERELTFARARLLREDVGLLTLTGPGGSGKTRLALHLAAEVLHAFDDGAWLVPLAPLRDPGLIPATILQALGLQDQGGRAPADLLRDVLRPKRLLLVVDNCEHLLEGVAVLGALLAEAPGLTVLATSRAPLHLRHEHELPVLPLALPDGGGALAPERLLAYGAVELFVRRVAAIQPAFGLDADNAAAVVEICRRLDGLPLALELAAARLRLLSPQTMLARLERRLPLLVGGARDLPARQQTLRATIAWSYDLLTDDEQRLFRRLGVFVGGCTLEAAEAVAGGGGNADDRPSPNTFHPTPITLDLLDSLVEKSLLRQQDGGGEPRFVMLETIREYALERLDAAGELAAVRRRHADYYGALAEEAEPALHGPAQIDWLDRLEADHDNFRAALTWSLQPGGDAVLGLRLAGVLAIWLWRQRGHMTEGRRWLTSVFAAVAGLPSDDRGTQAARVRALTGAGFLTQAQGEQEEALALMEECLLLARDLDDSLAIAWALIVLSRALLVLRRYDRHAEVLAESLARFRAAGDAGGCAYALWHLGSLAREQRDYPLAVARYEESVASARQSGDPWALSSALSWVGRNALVMGDLSRADLALRESLALSRRMRAPWLITLNLDGLMRAALHRGQFLRAARLLEVSELVRDSIGLQPGGPGRAGYEATLATLRSSLGVEVLEAALADGRAMSVEQAIEYALSENEPTPSGPVPLGQPTRADRDAMPLSAREVEVAALIARGLTNPAIAEALVISERTVHRHVSNILEKLDLRSRAQVAVWAAEHHLTAPNDG